MSEVPAEPRLSGAPTASALAVAFAMIFPTATAWTYFLALGGSGQANFLQQFVYGAGKVV